MTLVGIRSVSKTAFLLTMAALITGGAIIVLLVIRALTQPVVKVTRGELVSSFFASGRIKADREGSFSFQRVGRIISLPVKKNDFVLQGQILATIDTSDLKAGLGKSLADYEKSRNDFDQIQQDTYKDQATTNTILRAKKTAQAELNKSVYDVEIANRALKNASLYAPWDGVVTAVNGELNEWTSSLSTLPLISLVDPETIYFDAEVKEADMNKINEGTKVRVTLEAFPDENFDGLVVDIDQKAIVNSDGDTVVPVRISLQTKITPRVGLSGDAQFILQERESALLLPKKAARRRGNERIVLVREGIVTRERKIETGISDIRNIEVLAGLSEGDLVILPAE